MSIPAAWPRVLDFFGTPLVIEPSPGQLSSDAGLLPIRQFDERIGLYRRRSGTASLLLKACAVPGSVLDVTGLIVGSQDEQTTSPGRPCEMTCSRRRHHSCLPQAASRYSTGIAAFGTM
jgi:hypothetical protein